MVFLYLESTKVMKIRTLHLIMGRDSRCVCFPGKVDNCIALYDIFIE